MNDIYDNLYNVHEPETVKYISERKSPFKWEVEGGE